MTLRGLTVGAAALGSMVCMGCSDPAAPPAVGGAYIEVTAPSPPVPGKQCPHTGGAGITLGNVAPSVADKGQPLTDDEGGAAITCAVGKGDTINFNGTITKPPFSFRITGSIASSTGTGTASVADKGQPLTDDENGARVSCSVGSGDTINFNGTITKPPFSFRITGSIAKSTGSGTASVAFYDPNAVATFFSPTDNLCEVVATPEPMKIGGETAWARFSCPSLISKNNTGAACMAPVGYFFFDKCN